MRSIAPAKGAGRGRAYEQLRESILNLDLRPGARIDEGALVRSLCLSRTPVREALIRLAAEGLVELLPNRGARVSDMPINSLAEFFEAFTLTQRATHRWAASRRTARDIELIEIEHRRFAKVARADPEQIPAVNRAFHLAVAQAGRNSFLTQAYGVLLDQGLRISRMTVVYDPPRGLTRTQHFDAVVADHETILNAIRTQDVTKAESLAEAHADLFRLRVVDYLTSYDEMTAGRIALAG